MNALVGCVAAVIDGQHICLFVCKMSDGIVFKIFNALLTDHLTILVVIVKIDNFLHNGKQLLMCFVNGVHSNIKSIIPYNCVCHRRSPFLAGGRMKYFQPLIIFCLQAYYT